MQLTAYYKAPYWIVFYNGKKYVSRSKSHAIYKATHNQ